MGVSHNIAGLFGRKSRSDANGAVKDDAIPGPASLGSESLDMKKSIEHREHQEDRLRDSQQEPMELKIPFQSVAVVTATSQISSLVFCLAWSVKFNFYESTATHCRVDNYLPSLSATLDFTPQRDVWRACIGLSGIPRYFIAYLYYKLIYKSRVLLWFQWIEISALMGLSIVDSIRYFAFHATCVGIFLLTSIIHMTLVCNNFVRPNLAQLGDRTRLNLVKTMVVKKRIAIVNFIAIVTALYLYERHNRLCEPGVYSMFSFLEYIVIVANIIYHLQSYYDLEEYCVMVGRGAPSFPTKSAKTDMIDRKKD